MSDRERWKYIEDELRMKSWHIGVRLRAIVLSLLIIGLQACASAPAPAPALRSFDLVVLNARVVDGTGAPWFRADVGVRGDTIVEIGDLEGASAATVIDARDRVLSPGFIDLLGWDHGSVLVDPRLEGKIRQGVTSEATGEGNSPGPLSEAVVKERIAANPDRKGPVWTTLGDFMRVVENRGTALNFAFFVGATNPRAMVLGQTNRQPTEEEMLQMEQIIDQAMREGAIGLSTSLIYVPALYSTTEEIIRLAKIAAKYEGVYFTHIRDEGDVIESALDEAFRIGEEAEIPVNIWHLKVSKPANWGKMPSVVERIEDARVRGIDVAANVYPYIASSTGLTTRVPNWALEGGYAAFRERLNDPPTRAQIATEMRATMATLGGPARILVSRIPSSDMSRFERKNVEEIAAMMGVEPVEAMLRLFEANPYSPSGIFFSMHEDDLRHALRQPWVSAGSDAGAVVGEGVKAGAHPRAYGTFPRIVGHYVRDVKLFTLEEAVRKLTSQAAARIRLEDRGILRVGMKADMIVFDPETIRDVSVYEDPHHFSEGISDVIVNGVPVLRDGVMTGALPGRVLRGRGWNAEQR